MTLIMDDQGLVQVADQISRKNQGWQREVTVKWQDHKIRASIYRDSYDFQSRIKVEVWSQAALSWNTVRALAGEDHKDLPNAYCMQHEGGEAKVYLATEELVEELIAYAQEVLR